MRGAEEGRPGGTRERTVSRSSAAYAEPMVRLAAVAMVALVGCAHEAPVHREVVPPGPRTFAGLKGREVSVIIVDLDGRFSSSASSLAAARAAVTQQLRESGVMVLDGASHRLMFEVSGASPPDAASTQQCLRVSGRLEVFEQAFLPTQAAVAVRCGGRGLPGAVRDDVLGAVLAAGATAVRVANGGLERDRTEALFSALDNVLAQLDPVVRF